MSDNDRQSGLKARNKDYQGRTLLLNFLEEVMSDHIIKLTEQEGRWIRVHWKDNLCRLRVSMMFSSVKKGRKGN